MLFRRVVLSALLVGVLAGLLLSVVQRWQVIPIIETAERFAQAQAPQAEHAHAGHDHSAEAWQPAEGAERAAYTVLSNVLTAIGFALIILAAMAATLRSAAIARCQAVTRLDWLSGLLWGLAGYVTFFVAPALGLPPEIPGAESAPLEARQLWWVFTVLFTAAGLAGAVFGKSHWRWAALGLIIVPHLVGAPSPAGDPFAGHPPAVATELAALARQFVWATALANAVLWLALGLASIWAARWVLKDLVAGR